MYLKYLAISFCKELDKVSPAITYQLPNLARPGSLGRLVPMMRAKIVDEVEMVYIVTFLILNE